MPLTAQHNGTFRRARAVANAPCPVPQLASPSRLPPPSPLPPTPQDLYPVIPELLPPKWLPAEDVPHLIARLPNHDGRAAGGAAAAAAGAGAAAVAAH